MCSTNSFLLLLRACFDVYQLCLTAAVAAAAHGIGVLYLDTANSCNVRRMQQIARSRYADANGVSLEETLVSSFGKVELDDRWIKLYFAISCIN